MRTRRSRLLIIVVLAWVCGVLIPASAATLLRTPKKLPLRGRIVAHAPAIALASIGPNRDNYVFALESKNGREYVKLSYQFLLYEPRIPDDLFDYQMLLSFSAVRDQSCDEPARLLGASADGFSLKYAAGAPEVPSMDAVLPCYVVTPRDYKGAHRRPFARPVRAQADNGASGSGNGVSNQQ